MDKVKIAIDRLKLFEPTEGYYLAFSGGKDSITIKALADMAGVKYDAHYNVTSVDPPELVYFIKEHHPDVDFRYPMWKRENKVKTMWNLLERRSMPPTRLARYCCRELKEGGGEGRVVVTGVRWAESVRRKNTRKGVEMSKEEKFDFDNEEVAKLARTCPTKGKKIINPIIDWTDEDVWNFIKEYNIPYCKLYDEGFDRLGCIACPLSGGKQMIRDFQRWPKYYDRYLKTFDKMLKNMDAKGKEHKWQTPQDVMDWWVVWGIYKFEERGLETYQDAVEFLEKQERERKK